MPLTKSISDVFQGAGSPVGYQPVKTEATLLVTEITNGTIGVFTFGHTVHANGTLAMAFATAQTCRVTPNAIGTLTTTVPAAGTICELVILTSGVVSYTMTFGTGFKSSGTLATGTVTAKKFVITFLSDGTELLEKSRTAAL